MYSNILKTLLVCMLSAGALAVPASGDNNAVDDGTVSTRSAPKVLEKRGKGSVAWFQTKKPCTKSDAVGTVQNKWKCIDVQRFKPSGNDNWFLGWDWGKGPDNNASSVLLFGNPDCTGVLQRVLRKDQTDNDKTQMDYCPDTPDQDIGSMQYFDDSKHNETPQESSLLPSPSPAPTPAAMAPSGDHAFDPNFHPDTTSYGQLFGEK